MKNLEITNDYKNIIINELPLLDVRASIEFEKGAFINSTNIPILTTDERHIIGICYKEKGNEEATKLRKEEMIREKKTEAFHSSYQAYKAEHPLIGDVELWDSLSVAESPKVEADFFGIYEEVCGIQDTGV